MLRRSLWSSTMRAAVVLPALLVVLLATPLPVAATPEGEPTWTMHHGWTPTGELAFLPAVDARAHRAVTSMAPPASTVGHDRLQTRK
jgi:hypothetical protein